MRFYVEYSSNRVTGVKNSVFTREYQNVKVVGLQIVGFFLEYENFRVMNVRNRFRQNKIKFQNKIVRDLQNEYRYGARSKCVAG